jgi:hypothetical protein
MKKSKIVFPVIGTKMVPVITTLFVIFLFYLPTLGKDSAPGKTLYDSKPFDISRSRFPLHYNGHSPVAVYSKVKNVLVGKSEFETNDEYQTRINKDRQSLGLYAFLSLNDVSSGDFEKVSYDADAGELIATISQIHLNFVVSITMTSGEKGSYMGQNAFGAKVRVSKREATRCFVNFLNKLDSLSNIILKLPMSRDEAKRVKDSVKILYVGSPIQTKCDTAYWAPDVNYPYATRAEIIYLDMQLKEIWLYNYKTGDILLKCAEPESFEVKRD